MVAAVLVGMVLALGLLGLGYWLGGDARETKVVARYEKAMRVAGDNYIADREKQLGAAAARVADVERRRQRAEQRVGSLEHELENLPRAACDWSDDELRILRDIHRSGQGSSGGMPGDVQRGTGTAPAISGLGEGRHAVGARVRSPAREVRDSDERRRRALRTRQEQRGMAVELRVGETLKLDGGRIKITLLEKSGQRARMAIAAPPDIDVERPSKEGGPHDV